MSYNRDMDKQFQQDDVFTKANVDVASGVFLTSKDAEEFRAYKRRKKMTEVALAVTRSQGSLYNGEDLQRVCERAIRLRQAAIKTPLSKLDEAKKRLAGSFVRLDCVVGGDGETLDKVKAYEARLAVKKGAKEITVPVTPSLFDAARYTELRKGLKKIKRAIGKATLKVRVEKIYSPTALSRMARIASEIGAGYYSVPYFPGCERLRLDLTKGCLLETTGVETKETFQTLTEKGVERIVTDKAWEIYNDWMREAQDAPLTDKNAVVATTSGSDASSCATKFLEIAEKTNQAKKGETPTPRQEKMDIKLL